MKCYFVAFLLVIASPGFTQDTTRKQGFLFFRNSSFTPLECVFVEGVLNTDSSLEYNMLLLDEKKDTGIFVQPILLYKMDKRFEATISNASVFFNSYNHPPNVPARDDYEENKLNNYCRVLPVRLAFVFIGQTSMNTDESKRYDTPVTFQGKSILSKSRYSHTKWGLLLGLEKIELRGERAMK